MKTTILSAIITLAFFSLTCSAQTAYGTFTKSECPIEISDELASSGNFTFGYMTVPEFHKIPGSRAIELAVAIFKCRSESPRYEPLVLNRGDRGCPTWKILFPHLMVPWASCFSLTETL